MKSKSPNFPQLYRSKLGMHLKQGKITDIESASGLGALALAAGLQTLDLAKLHEKILVMELLPTYPASKRNQIMMQAATFFAAAISSKPSKNSSSGASNFNKVIEALSERTVQLATVNQLLRLEVIQRRKVEKSLLKCESKNIESLEKSGHLRDQLRKLSRRMMKVQEDERKKISRELHDVIAQELIGINIQLSTLKVSFGQKAKGLNRDIAITQRRIMRSANTIHKFARELRPTALDDLGLTAALHSMMKQFTERTKIRTHLTAFAGVDNLNSERSTVLYRVAQESLCNIARHADAHRAKLTIRKDGKFVRMDISDNGQSFDVEAELASRGNKHLGLLGMMERVEMTGGKFQIESAAGTGTTVTARIPVTKSMASQWRLETTGTKKKKS